LASLLVAREHTASHSAASYHPDHLVARHGLRLAPQLRAAIFAQECKALVGRGSFRLITRAAVQAFDYNDCGLSLRQFDLICILSWLKLRRDFYCKHGLAALYAVAVS